MLVPKIEHCFSHDLDDAAPQTRARRCHINHKVGCGTFSPPSPPQDDLDHSGVEEQAKTIPLAAEEVMAAVRNTTSSWKKDRVQPLPETLGKQRGTYFPAQSDAIAAQFFATLGVQTT